MGEKDKNTVHPIVEKVVYMFHIYDDQYELDEYAVEQIEDLLKEYYGSYELREAVMGLIHLAHFLDVKCNSKAASQKVLKAIISSTEALEELNRRDST